MSSLDTAFALGTLGAFGICALARNLTVNADRLARAASWITLLAGMTWFIRLTLPEPWSKVHLPAQDLALMALAYTWWQVRREWWAAAIGAVSFVLLVDHVAFWIGAQGPSSRRHAIIANASFIAQLVALYAAGGVYVARCALDRAALSRGRALARVPVAGGRAR